MNFKDFDRLKGMGIYVVDVGDLDFIRFVLWID